MYSTSPGRVSDGSFSPLQEKKKNARQRREKKRKRGAGFNASEFSLVVDTVWKKWRLVVCIRQGAPKRGKIAFGRRGLKQLHTVPQQETCIFSTYIALRPNVRDASFCVKSRLASPRGEDEPKHEKKNAVRMLSSR